MNDHAMTPSTRPAVDRHQAPSSRDVDCITIDHLSQAAYLYEPIFADGAIVDLRIVEWNETARRLRLTESVVPGVLVTDVFVDVHQALDAAQVAWDGGTPDPYIIVRRGLVDGAMTTIRYEIATARVGDLLLQTSRDQTVDHRLEQSEGRLRSIIESLDEAITISQPLFDDDMQLVGLRTLYSNASAAEVHDHLVRFVERGLLAPRLDRARAVLAGGDPLPVRVDNVDGTVAGVAAMELEIEDSLVGDLVVEVVRNHTERRLATLADQRARRRFAATIDALADAVGIFEPVYDDGVIADFRLVYANRAMSGFLDVGETISTLRTGQSALVELGRRAMSRPGDALHTSFTTGPSAAVRAWRASLVAVDEQLVAVAADVTEMHDALVRVTESEDLLRTVLHALSESVQVFDRDGGLLYANASSVDLLGEADGDHPAPYLVLPTDDDYALPRSEWPLERGRRGEEIDGLVVRIARRGTPTKTVRVAVRSVTDATTSEPSIVVVSAHDITDEQARAAELEWLSTHSGQSRLLNREGLVRRIDERFAADGRGFAVIWVKLTALDSLRPTFGFGVVDDAVADAAVRLSAIAAECDGLAAHPSENALALVVPDASPSGVSPDFVNRVIARLSVPVSTGSVTLLLEPVAGVAFGPAHPADLDTVLHRAKSAAWTAERSGVDQTFWQPHHGIEQVRRVALLGDVERAMLGGEMSLAYQPKFALGSGDLVGAEALARWVRPAAEPLRPDEFIPAIEASGLARPFTLWAIERALAQWEPIAAIAPTTSVAVNVPASLIADPAFHDEVAAILERQRAAPGTLLLEMTERTIGGHVAAIGAGVERLARSGVRVSIDDFGTGQSSLAHLRHLRVAEVKVDRTFVSGAGADTDPVHLSVLRACADIGRAAGVSVCAEGVETADELDVVSGLGFDTVQGFLTGRPASIERVLALAKGAPAHPAARPSPVRHQSVGR